MFVPSTSQWQIKPTLNLPPWFLEAVGACTPATDGRYLAQLLWQRDIRTREQLTIFLNPDAYKPTSPVAFGQEMKWAVNRLASAREAGEKVAIWGDFDADGITATSVLWEGLGQFFPQEEQLTYYIPNRFKESHGLNQLGIDQLAASGIKLIVTCDTGSTNLWEIDYAKRLGLDLIITDHHSLPPERPEVVSIINPRYFHESHPLFHLSGVAVAYKLIEALYSSFPQIPQQPVEDLLDLVAIGLVADLVSLTGDCRYLAHQGIKRLRQTKRPGVACLLQLCQRTGDRPMDISFGLGPRINAVSRIHGDASFCVRLLTSRNKKECEQLANSAELANTRRKSLQKDVVESAKKKLAQMDLSTTGVIVLDDPQWEVGVLGLVAGEIAQQWGRPTILLTTGAEENSSSGQDTQDTTQKQLARGSARSVNNLDLYQLVLSQANLLHRFGGHPFAAGLSLPVENLALFREGIDRQLRQQIADLSTMRPIVKADLTVTVSELSQALFRELKLLEPYGMGNPVPQLLIENCWFDGVWNKNARDLKGKQVRYIKTTFQIWDEGAQESFPGVWWGHYKEELPQQTRCDAIVELDFNAYRKRYEVRLIAVRERNESIAGSLRDGNISSQELILDCRPREGEDWSKNRSSNESGKEEFIALTECPRSWQEVQLGYDKACAAGAKLALTYPPPDESKSSAAIWQQLVGIAKYLSRTGKKVTREQLKGKLGASDRALDLGLAALTAVGFHWQETEELIQLSWTEDRFKNGQESIILFLEALEEEQFQRQYFWRIPLETMERLLRS